MSGKYGEQISTQSASSHDLLFCCRSSIWKIILNVVLLIKFVIFLHHIKKKSWCSGKKDDRGKKTLSTGGLGQQIMYLQENLLELSELNTLEKRQYLPHYWSDKGFKVTVVNRTLPSAHEGHLKKTLTVPLIMRILYFLKSCWKIVKLMFRILSQNCKILVV